MMKFISIFNYGWLAFIIVYGVFLDRFYLMTIVGSVPSIFFLLLPVINILLVAFFSRTMMNLIISLFGLCIGFGYFDYVKPNLTSNGVSSGAVNVKVVNWNTEMWESTDNLEEFYMFLKSLNADIYVLQEKLYSIDNNSFQEQVAVNTFPITRVTNEFPRVYYPIDIANEVEKYFPNYYVAEDHQFVVLSRYPIVNSFIDKSDQFQVVDLNIHDKLFRIFNVHIVMHLENFNPFSSEFYEGAKIRYEARKVGLDNLFSEMHEYGGEYLVAGDFNSSLNMGVMSRYINSNLDLFEYGVDWMPKTVRVFGLRLWRIDWVFLKNESNINVLKFRNIENKDFSDHSYQVFELGIESKCCF